MKTYVYVLAALIAFSSCNKCADLSCGTVGECESGECVCPAPYSGDRCAVHLYADYNGRYVGQMDVVWGDSSYSYSDIIPFRVGTLDAGGDQIWGERITWGDDGAFTFVDYGIECGSGTIDDTGLNYTWSKIEEDGTIISTRTFSGTKIDE